MPFADNEQDKGINFEALTIKLQNVPNRNLGSICTLAKVTHARFLHRSAFRPRFKARPVRKVEKLGFLRLLLATGSKF